ncbi:MAG: hypothetical protein QOC73_944 [Actinomycetota bacterium]|jgi:uncharacterized protein (TIGR03083 family)|nr:hypothetical protein [Actinomycetota bacterium]MDQ1493741.1 hypothetical protein [Actinomycetota bacterium]MDQ1542075.1 hypothetical protein [Actinomycetota bacterium]
MLARMVGSRDVLAAAETCRRVFEPVLERDWTVPVPGLDFTVASALAHAANVGLWYAADLWVGLGDDGAYEVKVRPDDPNEKILKSLLVAAQVCAASIAAAPPTTRGFHPFGAADPSGFAAMACDELLVHGDDAARGLGLRLEPDPDLAARVLARLYPWHPSAADPWQGLLWANGRIDIAGLPNQQGWRWHSQPLSEWDGSTPVLATDRTAPATPPG